jgi:hypothetical protein
MTTRQLSSLLILLALWGSIEAPLAHAQATRPASDVSILPGDFTLAGPSARQALVVERMSDSKPAGEITDGVTIRSGDDSIARIEAGVALPVADGSTTITARAGDLSAAVKVIVRDVQKNDAPSFRNNVQPILAAAGCSSGACHGAAAGKNGFKLSLRGFDDEGDWRAITRHAMGRRILPADPAHSLLLLKPTGAVAHKGGIRLKVGSPEYQTVADWIASGAPGPSDADPRIERIEVLPPQATVRPGDAQQMLVLAHFSDGSTQDVTRWAKYTAADATVCSVEEGGKVKITGHGEGPVTAWYMSRIATATITSPFEGDAGGAFAAAGRRNFIDDLVLEKLKSLNLPPSPPAGDSEFLRRACIDTIGTLPTADETRAFLADTSADKRDKLIERLLARPEFVDYWAYKWSDLLLVSSRKLSKPGMWAYYNWVRQQVEDNVPWDQLARRIVTATGDTLENGAGNFFLLHDDPTKMSETASVAFLGMSINCAKCHNHPMEKWTNNQYYGMANLFARVRTKNGAGSTMGDGNFVVFSATEGDLVQPLTGRPQAPRPLDGNASPIDDPADRRLAFADWLVAPDNPYFSRAITNRVWANFMGVGLVESVDDMRKTNPASNEMLLSALSGYLADQHFDLKALMRLILQSATYQRSSQPLPDSAGLAGNAADRRFYSRYYPRRLMAEVMLDATSQVTAEPTMFPGYSPGTRAIQLPDSNIDSYFLKSFGRPDRTNTCECERSAMPSMAQVLNISNGDTINQKLQAKGNRIDQLLKADTPDEKIIEELYLSALSRYPTDTETGQLRAALSGAGADTKREVIEDLYWGVLSSKQFLFDH